MQTNPAASTPTNNHQHDTLAMPHLQRLGLGEPEFEGRISRRDIDRHKTVSNLLNAEDMNKLRRRVGLLDARHIIPAKWFTHSFNRVWSRVINNPENLKPVAIALEEIAALARHDSPRAVIPMLLDFDPDTQPDTIRQALLDLTRTAINQELNLFIGPRDINQINGGLIGRTRRLLCAHDKILALYGSWCGGGIRYAELMQPNPPPALVKEYRLSVEKLARQFEKILFNPAASPATALSYGKAKINQMSKIEIEHLAPPLEAMLDTLYNLGKAIEPPTEATRTLLDLATGIVDSVCVDPSQIGELHDGAVDDENLQRFRAVQNDLLLNLGAGLISGSTRLCNALDAGDAIEARAAARQYVSSLEGMTQLGTTLGTLWEIPEDPVAVGAILAGIASPKPRASTQDIACFRKQWREAHFQPRRLPIAPGEEDFLRFCRNNAVGLCHRATTPDWIRDLRQYLHYAARGRSLFDPWIEQPSNITPFRQTA